MNIYNTIIPNEIISHIIEYIPHIVGFDYKFCKYTKHYRFIYNKYNIKSKILNELFSEKWCIRKFYDMSKQENKSVKNHNNFINITNEFCAIYYTPYQKEYDNKKIKISVFTDINDITTIGVYKKIYDVVYFISKKTF
jgi:hypothetical protein